MSTRQSIVLRSHKLVKCDLSLMHSRPDCILVSDRTLSPEYSSPLRTPLADKDTTSVVDILQSALCLFQV